MIGILFNLCGRIFCVRLLFTLSQGHLVLSGAIFLFPFGVVQRSASCDSADAGKDSENEAEWIVPIQDAG